MPVFRATGSGGRRRYHGWQVTHSRGECEEAVVDMVKHAHWEEMCEFLDCHGAGATCTEGRCVSATRLCVNKSHILENSVEMSRMSW